MSTLHGQKETRGGARPGSGRKKKFHVEKFRNELWNDLLIEAKKHGITFSQALAKGCFDSSKTRSQAYQFKLLEQLCPKPTPVTNVKVEPSQANAPVIYLPDQKPDPAKNMNLAEVVSKN